MVLASNLVLSYLRKTNRPYSATDITNNLHNAVTKTSLQKILQQLVEAGTVYCKTQGTSSFPLESK
jgi:26S proteasome regulatory subunit, ATPase 3, interacting protein